MIKHGRITLRHMQQADLPVVMKAMADSLARGDFNPSRILGPQSVLKRFNEDGYSSDEREMLLVCDESGAVIGNVLHFPAKRYSTAREIGWTIHDPALRGRGYATEAVSALIDYLFRSYPINRLECNTSTANLASIRLAEKCGFVREGVLRGLVFVAGVYVDDVVFSIVRAEWQARRPA